MAVFISSNFIDLPLFSLLCCRCLGPLSLGPFWSTLAFGLAVSQFSTSSALVIPCWAWRSARWVRTSCSVHMSAHYLLKGSSLGEVCFASEWHWLSFYSFNPMALRLSEMAMCVRAHFEHLGCCCCQVKSKQLLDEFLVTEGSDKSVLDILFLLLFCQEAALISKSSEMVDEFIWCLSRSDANIFQLVDFAVLWYCMVHRRWQVVHEGCSSASSSSQSHQLCQLASNGQTSCSQCCPGNWACTPGQVELGSAVGSCWCLHWNILKSEPTFHWFTKQLEIIILLRGIPVEGWCHEQNRVVDLEGVSWVQLWELWLGLLDPQGQEVAWLKVCARRAFWGHWR